MKNYKFYKINPIKYNCKIIKQNYRIKFKSIIFVSKDQRELLNLTSKGVSSFSNFKLSLLGEIYPIRDKSRGVKDDERHQGVEIPVPGRRYIIQRTR